MFDRVGLLSFSVILYTKLQNKEQYLEVALDVGESCTRGRHDGQDTTDSNAPAPLHHFGEGVSHVWCCRRGVGTRLGDSPLWRLTQLIIVEHASNSWPLSANTISRPGICDELTFQVTQLSRNI